MTVWLCAEVSVSKKSSAGAATTVIGIGELVELA
jgi:hypothetical protein